ncbi:hypothetical protein [Gimesia chilikensis]|uniref:hypothetical protein n=1 Tax=Gimesia chilikensis TaxID=2605989 RepID=UPI003A8FB842
MLRRSFLNEIRQELNLHPYVYPEDFEISSSTQTVTSKLIIRYLYDTSRCFTATIDNERKTYDEVDYTPSLKVTLRYSPGDIAGDEREVVYGKNSLLRAIGEWAARIKEDLCLEPNLRATEELGKKMQSFEDQLKDIPDNPASEEQLEKLRDLINDVEKQLTEQIESLEDSVEVKEKRIKELEIQFELLRENAKSGNFRDILRQLGSRFYRVASDPSLPKLIQNGKKIAGLLDSTDTDGMMD